MKTNVKFAALALLATAMITTSCGNNAGRKQAAETVTEIERQAEKALDVKNVSARWENNEFTKQVPKPEMAITAAGESSMGYSANFNNATLEQIKAYAAKVKAAGFSVGAYETDGDPYMYTADNAAGWSVMISWTAGQSGVLISKPN